MDIKHNYLVAKRENRGEEGSKQVTLNYIAATEASKSGFGAAKHLVLRNKDGKNFSAGNTYIEEFFCSNISKVDSLMICVFSYNRKNIVIIREFCDASNVDSGVKWSPSKHYFFRHFTKTPLHIALEH